MPDKLTEFQQRLLTYLESKEPLRSIDAWTIAREVYPEKWERRSGRGVLIVHIDRAAAKLEDRVERIGARDQYGCAKYFLKDQKYL